MELLQSQAQTEKELTDQIRSEMKAGNGLVGHWTKVEN